MALKQGENSKKKLFKQLLIIVILMLSGMTGYETIKQFLFPDITVWQSHIITIIFSTVCATTVSFFILQRQNVLNRSLSLKNIESERLKRGLEETVDELEVSLKQIKTLSGMLPICSVCKKIRDDRGYWNQIEKYICEHSNADFSHSLCPECAEKLYPDYKKKEE